MTFKETLPQLQIVEISRIESDPTHPRQHIDDDALKSLANSIYKKGLIHPLVVQPANGAGQHTLIVGERRLRAAILAGEQTVPVLIHRCEAAEVLEVQIFENLGLGVRVALEPRDMANAIQRIAEGFETPETAAEHFGRSSAWLSQATAAANLSPKVSALLDSGKIASAGTAIQLEKLVKKNEAKAELLIGQTEQLPEGTKLAKKVVDTALAEEGGRRKKKEVSATEVVSIEPAEKSIGDIPPWEELPVTPSASRSRVNPGKVKLVADLLGLSDGDEEEILVRLIDEYLALKGEAGAAF
ncbi:MAG TPA: ParB/RepB/Spo0J family partition protein [Azonexus sp.]|nr:ParB/RepB/Spo0J family partition protein [Azonexus sp.]